MTVLCILFCVRFTASQRSAYDINRQQHPVVPWQCLLLLLLLATQRGWCSRLHNNHAFATTEAPL